MRPWPLVFLLLLSFTASAAPIPATGTVDVAFSPHGGATELVVSAIQGARKQILVQAYSFTSAPIAKALVEAKRRGVDVRVVLDKSQETEKYSGATYLAAKAKATVSPRCSPCAGRGWGGAHRRMPGGSDGMVARPEERLVYN